MTLNLILIYLLIGLMISVINNSWSKVDDEGKPKLKGMRAIQIGFSVVWWLPGICWLYYKRGKGSSNA